MSQGTEMSRNLRELSVSLRHNAERLLRDVRLAHGGMTARLDQTTPGSHEERGRASRARGRREDGEDGPDDLDVPEFMPRG